MKKEIQPFIYGFGAYAPEKILTNNDIAQFVDTSDEWISTRTGIKSRHIAAEDQINSDLATNAALNAIKHCGIDKEAITHILLASCTPDSTSPSTACLISDKLGLKGRFALDINAACSGFLYGLEVARSLAITDPNAVVLLIGSEILSRRSNWEDRTTCVLFGDGAGAAIVSQKDFGSKTLHAQLIDGLHSSDGSLGELLEIKGGFSSHAYKLGDIVGPEYFIRMQGQEVFKNAVRSMSGICKQLLENNNVSIDEIDVVIPHQANIRIIEAVGSRIHVSAEKVFVNVQKYGNTSVASIPLALSEAIETGFIKKGNKVLLVAFGGGFTWSAYLLQF